MENTVEVVDGKEFIRVDDYRGGNTFIPVDLLQSISDLGTGMYALEEALSFWRAIQDSKSHEWVEAKDLLGRDLKGYLGRYFIANYEDSEWDYISFDKSKVSVNQDGGISISWDDEESYPAPEDRHDPEYPFDPEDYRTLRYFDPREKILLIKK